MCDRRPARSAAREWLVAAMAYSLLVAPFGCEVQLDWLKPGDNLPATGLFINADLSDPLIVAGRSAGGDAFFVYGTRTADGLIGEVEAILVRTADGGESVILFESGRPTSIEGPDGSFVRIDYTDTGDEIEVNAEVFDASSGATHNVSFVLDLPDTAALHAAATDAAAAIAALTGATIIVPAAPDGGTSKVQNRALGPVAAFLVAATIVAMSQVLLVVAAEVMEVMTAVVGVIVFAAFSPVLLFAALLSSVLTTITEVPLVEIFIELPTRPTR